VTNSTAAPVSSAIPQQLGLHPLAGHLVQRAEGLVHEQQLRPGGQRPGDRHPLLHAAGELAGTQRGELGEADQREQLRRAGAALGLRDPVHMQGQLDVRRDRPPLQQAGLLNAMP
jgi:hypothetical protein